MDEDANSLHLSWRVAFSLSVSCFVETSSGSSALMMRAATSATSSSGIVGWSTVVVGVGVVGAVEFASFSLVEFEPCGADLSPDWRRCRVCESAGAAIFDSGFDVSSEI